MKSDKETTIQELKDLLQEFRDKRDWAQFHNLKDLAEAIAVEAGELQELFLWQSKEEVVKKLRQDKGFREEIGDELADVINYCLNFANAGEFDISSVVRGKVAKADKKYPVKKSKGRADKYNKL